MKLVIASNNVKKRSEIETILGNLGIELVSAQDTVFVEVKEDADDFAGNAKKKAEAFAAANRCAALGDDSGLCVDALNGAPGVCSSRFAGENATDVENNEKLIIALNGVENRGTHFTCTIHLQFPNGHFLRAEGRVDGEIREKPGGQTGFGYDPLFFCPELGKTFAEATPDEKASVSHRGRALRALAAQLQPFV